MEKASFCSLIHFNLFRKYTFHLSDITGMDEKENHGKHKEKPRKGQEREEEKKGFWLSRNNRS
jgi:hypothetical protein